MADNHQEQHRDTLRPLPPRAHAGPKLVVGCGYLGRRVAERWRAASHEVYAITRSRKHGEEFAQAGIRPIVADVMRLETLTSVPAAATVLYAVGYDRTQSRGIEEVYLRGLVNVLNALPSGTGRVIYVSSTGVYGDRGGEWIDEHTPCFPDRTGGKACLAAEEALLAHPRGADSIILRMAGIYGPGRIPSRDALEAGRTIAAPAKGWLNLIHVDDAASVVLAAEQALHGHRYYLVSDGCPINRREYYAELARLLDAPKPRFLSPDATLPSAVRATSDKRVSNARLVRELRVQLAYPSYREGLAAIINGG
ncbi:MAG TPA: SDR family oxidoreductase [Pirellulales bacterium]|jgi:nucleoside-diphosphate-sugar epimerase